MSVESLIDYWNDDDMRDKMLAVMENYADGPSYAEPISEPTPLGIGSDPYSTLAPMPEFKPEEHPELFAPLFRPELEIPEDLNMMYVLIQKVHGKMEEQSTRSTKIFKIQIDRDMFEVERLNYEKHQAIVRHAKEIENKNTWGILGTIAQYIATAASLVLGIACIASGVGTAAGALLIASGGLGLANRVMTDTGAWSAVVSWFIKSEELQQKIAQRIDMGFFFVSLGLGLAGGIWAVQGGALSAIRAAGTDAAVAKVGQILTLAGGISTAVTRMGEASTDNKVKQIEALMKRAEAQIFLSYEYMNENTKNVEKIIETTKMMGEDIQKSIRVHREFI